MIVSYIYTHREAGLNKFSLNHGYSNHGLPSNNQDSNRIKIEAMYNDIGVVQ